MNTTTAPDPQPFADLTNTLHTLGHTLFVLVLAIMAVGFALTAYSSRTRTRARTR